MAAFSPEQALAEAKREFGEHGGVSPSIARSSTFTVMSARTMSEIFQGHKGPDRGGCFLYSRHANPTVSVLARYLAAMEDTEAAVCTASGISAIACALLQLCGHGDHIVSSRTVYGGTHALLADLFPSIGIHTTFVDVEDVGSFETAITPRTRAIYVESLGNPTLPVADIRALGQIAKQHQVPLVVDNTFTPMILSPARLGADIVVYSLTKFVNGASDLLAGAICGSGAFAGRLTDLHTGRVALLGPTPDPRAAYDLIQRLPHLAIRMREHGRRALAIAEALERIGARVVYPGLASHPGHALLSGMMNPGYGYGGMIALDLGTREKAEALMDRLQNQERFGLMAVSLGYYDTLISCSSATTASEIPPEAQRRIGLLPGLLRLSIGYTGAIDARVEQLVRAVQDAGVTA